MPPSLRQAAATAERCCPCIGWAGRPRRRPAAVRRRSACKSEATAASSPVVGIVARGTSSVSTAMLEEAMSCWQHAASAREAWGSSGGTTGRATKERQAQDGGSGGGSGGGVPNTCEARQRSQTRTFASFAARMHFFVRSLARPLSRSELRPIRAESGRRAELDGPQIALFAVLACFASAIANFAALLGGGFARRRQSRTGQRPDWVGREVHFCVAKLANLAKLAKPRVGPRGGSSTRLRTICKVMQPADPQTTPPSLPPLPHAHAPPAQCNMPLIS